MALIDQREGRAHPLVRALRPHQWLKNLLVLVPVILDHKVLDSGAVGAGAVAFAAFCLCASGVYVLNDLVDIERDRVHPRKRFRPFAAGELSPRIGMAMAAALLCAAALLALFLPPLFAAALATYFLTTLAYSLLLKRTLLFDVLCLAGLYTLRVIAGALATGIALSFWLLAFSTFLFLSLALVKRYVELAQLGAVGEKLSTGRGYRAEDLDTLSQLGIASGLVAVLVLALYIDSDAVRSQYRTPEAIWLICPILLYLVCRIWVLARRREMHDDPVVWALRDWRSQVMMGLAAVLMFFAAR